MWTRPHGVSIKIQMYNIIRTEIDKRELFVLRLKMKYKKKLMQSMMLNERN